MAAATLLEVVNRRFGVHVDAASDGGQVLNSLTVHPDFADPEVSGEADGTMTLTPTLSGVRLRPADAGDALLFQLPVGSFSFTLVPPAPAGSGEVEILLVAPKVPLPFLRAASLNAEGMLDEAAGDVRLALPNLLLVVSATENPPASARLAPSHGAAGELEVSMDPPLALLGPGTVLGLGFTKGTLTLEGASAPLIGVKNLDVYVEPEGIPALAMTGGGHDLTIGLGVVDAGLRGEFTLALAGEAQAPKRPRFLKRMATRLRLQRSSVTLLELTGQIELGDEVGNQLGQALPDSPGAVDYLLRLTLDNSAWEAQLSLSSAANAGYLWRTQRTNAGARDLIRDTLGAYAVFSPLLVPALPDPDGSGYTNLALGAGAAAAVAGSHWASTRSLTLVGGTLIVRKPAGQHPQGFLFFELEAEVDLDVEVAGTKLIATRRPLKVLQKAIGVELDFGAGGAGPQLKPVFDPKQGFALDLSDPGTFEIPGPLGEILQPDAARMSRENPVNFEVDVITKADLGVVTIDRASVRVPLEGGSSPTLTGLGAHVNAGPIQGAGYLRVLADGIAGGFDAMFSPPLGIRATADLNLGKAHDPRSNEDLTSVLAAFSVEWPIPIPLANSGLGLFGFLGLFAMHKERKESAQGALQWLIDANGDPAKGAWQGSAHRWALGLGAVIGTTEGGFLIHAKGMLLLELPGPRLLLMMKADILSARPPKEGKDTGTLLAVIDLRPESLTIGIVADYKIPFLLEVRVPVEAFFDFRTAENWHLDVGGIPEAVPPKLPASVQFMSSLRADGYMLIHGDGIPDFPLRALQGLSVAAGVRAALTWGPEEIGLYIRVAARADVGISFKPMLIIGKATLEGELHLFIVSIGASAIAELTIIGTRYYVKASVCGEVEFFLFSVDGCVTLELGDESITHNLPAPEPMIRALSLHSRSPALLPGSGADRPIDSSLGSAFHEHDGQFVGATPEATIPVVPIDSIPVLQFEMRPHTDLACRFFTQPIFSLLDATSWVRRGARFYRYTLKQILLTKVDDHGADLGSPLDEGDTPAVWWDRHGKLTPGDDSDVQLALLTWIPDPTPVAAERTITRDNEIKHRWGNVCAEIAPPASVLWTFSRTSPGPSSRGWLRHGTVSRDPLGTIRSSSPDDQIVVSEPWRAKDRLADSLVSVTPAFIYATDTNPERLLIAPRTGDKLRPRFEDDERFRALWETIAHDRQDQLRDGLRLDSEGTQRIRGLVFVQFEIGDLVLRGVDSDGNPTGFEEPLGPRSHAIHSLNDLPAEWTDPAGPWFSPVDAIVTAWFEVFVGPLGEPQLLLFELDLPNDTAQVEVGLRGGGRELRNPEWGVLALEATGSTEFVRFEFDKDQRSKRIAVVDGALGADQAKRALLRPNATYDVKVSYDVVATGVDASGKPASNPTAFNDQVQHFRFKTDAAPPRRLDSWTLATAPADAEASFFYADPVRIVFATNATRKLFKAYGRDLFAVVRAASGKHPPASQGFDPADVQVEFAKVNPVSLAAFAMPPFEGALREAVADQDCVDSEQATSSHELVTLTLQLEPTTEYIVDLQARPASGDPAYPLLRRKFATSRYPTMGAFAADVASATVAHRSLADSSPLIQLAAAGPNPFALTDLELETALRAARWGDLQRPATPRAAVVWQTDGAGVEQPVALLLETTESHWRTRGIPELSGGPAGDPNVVKRYTLADRPWLELVDTSATPGLVARFVRSRDCSRTLALLKPGARGTTLTLALRRTSHPLFEGTTAATDAACVTVNLAHPPWELPA